MYTIAWRHGGLRRRENRYNQEIPRNLCQDVDVKKMVAVKVVVMYIAGLGAGAMQPLFFVNIEIEAFGFITYNTCIWIDIPICMSVMPMYIHTYDLPVQYLINTSTVYIYVS